MITSSMAEHPTVNRTVPGSSPGWSAVFRHLVKMLHEQVSYGATPPSSRDGLWVYRDRDPRNYGILRMTTSSIKY